MESLMGQQRTAQRVSKRDFELRHVRGLGFIMVEPRKLKNLNSKLNPTI